MGADAPQSLTCIRVCIVAGVVCMALCLCLRVRTGVRVYGCVHSYACAGERRNMVLESIQPTAQEEAPRCVRASACLCVRAHACISVRASHGVCAHTSACSKHIYIMHTNVHKHTHTTVQSRAFEVSVPQPKPNEYLEFTSGFSHWPGEVCMSVRVPSACINENAALPILFCCMQTRL